MICVRFVDDLTGEKAQRLLVAVSEAKDKRPDPLHPVLEHGGCQARCEAGSALKTTLSHASGTPL